MRINLWVVGLAFLVASGAVNAKARFQQYEARDATVIGKGGARISKDGVDFWTIGDPPRSYRIIGVISDRRGTGMAHGKAVGSSHIAKMVREAGGDALILLNENTEFRGFVQSGSAYSSGGRAFGTGFAIPIQRKETTFFVVKYLEPTSSIQP